SEGAGQGSKIRTRGGNLVNPSRRAFLAAVGRSAIGAWVGPAIAADLGLLACSAPGRATHGTRLNVQIPGEWYALGGGESGSEWAHMGTTPGEVTLQPGAVYHLDIAPGLTGEGLASLAQLRGLPCLRRLSLAVCEGVTDASLTHLRGLDALRCIELNS